jgi:hypothetical protein
MTSSRHGPYAWGYTHATMDRTEGCKTARWSQSQKPVLSWNWGLQLDPMNAESLVTAGQPNGGESVPGPCTHRPSSHLSLLHPKWAAQPLLRAEGAHEGVAGKGD